MWSPCGRTPGSWGGLPIFSYGLKKWLLVLSLRFGFNSVPLFYRPFFLLAFEWLIKNKFQIAWHLCCVPWMPSKRYCCGRIYADFSIWVVRALLGWPGELSLSSGSASWNREVTFTLSDFGETHSLRLSLEKGISKLSSWKITGEEGSEVVPWPPGDPWYFPQWLGHRL